MKLDEKDLFNIIENVINNNLTDDTKEINETNFQLDPKDPKLDQKVKDIKDNSAIFDKNKDVITVGDNTKIASESVYTKGDIIKAINEAKNKARKITSDDYVKAIKKADREIDYEKYGPGWKSKDRAHKNKSKYDRKHMATSDLDLEESIMTKKDVEKIILEKKYSGKLYSKAELIEMIKK